MGKAQLVPVNKVEMSKDELLFWKKEIQASIKRQKDEFIARIGFEELIRYFEGLQVASANDLRQLAIVDEFSPAILSVITNTYYQNPSVSVEARNPSADGMVKPQLMYLLQHPDFVPFKLTDLLKASLRYGMDHTHMKEEMQLANFDLMVAGFACVEMNHEAKTGNEQQETMDDTPDPSELVQELSTKSQFGKSLDDMIGTVKGAVNGLFGKKDEEGSMTSDEVAEKVASETPAEERIDFTDATYCKRWNPLDVLFDSRANVFPESRFIAKVVRKTVAEFNVMYPQFKDKVQQATGYMETMLYSTHDALKNKKFVTLYEVEIKKARGRNCILVMANGVDESIDYYEKPILSNRFGMKYSTIDKYGKIYPMSRAKKAKKPQDDINHYMTIQFEHIDRAMRKVAVYMNGLTESGKRAQSSSDIYALVEKSSAGTVYEEMPAPHPLPEGMGLVNELKDSINKAVGTSELAKNGQSDNKLATQDLIEKQTFQVNISSVQDALQELADQLIDELKDIQQQLWDGDDFFKITGIKGGDQWYTPDMGPLADVLVGDYLVKTSIVSAARPDPMKDRADAVQYAQIVTSPPMMMFAEMHGKRPTMEVLEHLAKVFDQNPTMVYEDIPPPPPMMGVPGMPPPGAQGPQMPPQALPPVSGSGPAIPTPRLVNGHPTVHPAVNAHAL